MKRLLMILATLSLPAFSADLIWDDDNPIDAVAHFIIEREVSPNNWTNIATTTTKRWTIILPSGQQKVRVVAVGVDGMKSDPSTNKPIFVLLIPNNLRIEQ